MLLAGGTGGTGLAEYAFIFNNNGQTIPVRENVVFDSIGVITSGITYVVGTDVITVNTPGDYEIIFTVTTNEPSQFAVFRNGSLVDGSLYGSSSSGEQQNSGQFIVTLDAGDRLVLRKWISSSTVTLPIFTGGTQDIINASIILKKLN